MRSPTRTTSPRPAKIEAAALAGVTAPQSGTHLLFDYHEEGLFRVVVSKTSSKGIFLRKSKGDRGPMFDDCI
ncbi:hypothetical protein TeGR_g8406, partial [Tetraparma gracilis]